MIFDTHAHYDDEAFNIDRDELIKSLKLNKINKVVNVCSSLDSVNRTISLCNKYEDFYGALGIHPSDCGNLNLKNFEYIESLLHTDKIVAVGEIGLDYHYDEPSIEIQKKWFIHQIDIARRNSLPLIIHSRDAAKDTIDIMKAEKCETIGGVIHCYSYSVEMSREYLNMDYYIGVGGVVTFSNAQKLIDVVKYAPIEKIVTETDSPYLAPTPNRGKRNTSLNIPLIIKRIAEIKGLSIEKTEDILYNNALKLYNLGE